MTTRKFEDKPAVRASVPLWIGIGGPSGGGKTLGALRLAAGIQRVVGGLIYVIDTEADRALHYAPREGEKANPPQTFDFRHLSFHAPFGSLDYLAAVKHCYDKGGRVMVIDQFSSEHDGVGGVLEQFEEELERLSKGDQARAERVKMLAWKKPKMNRRKMTNELLQMPVSIIGCFRTKTKLKLERGKEPVPLGYMPITGDELIFEFPVRLLVKNGSNGVPTLDPEEVGEREWVRVPQFCRDFIRPGQPLSEEMGERLAKWAEGSAPSAEAGLLAEVGRELASRHPGRSREELKAKGDALELAFGTRDWRAVEKLDANRLRDGLLRLQAPTGSRPASSDADLFADEAAAREQAEAEAYAAGV